MQVSWSPRPIFPRPTPRHNPAMRTTLLTLLGVNAIILMWPVLMLAAMWYGAADEQWLVRAASPFVLPFTVLLWYIVIRAWRKSCGS